MSAYDVCCITNCVQTREVSQFGWWVFGESVGMADTERHERTVASQALTREMNSTKQLIAENWLISFLMWLRRQMFLKNAH